MTNWLSVLKLVWRPGTLFVSRIDNIEPKEPIELGPNEEYEFAYRALPPRVADDTHTGDDARPPDPEPLNAAAVRRRLDGGDAA